MRKLNSTHMTWIGLTLMSVMLTPTEAYSKTELKSLREKHTRLYKVKKYKAKRLKRTPLVIKQKETYESVLKSVFHKKYVGQEFLSWGVSHTDENSTINLLSAWKKYSKNKDISVAVIDTGIDPNHPFLKNNIIVSKGSQSTENYGIDFSKNKKNISKPIDTHGHGTHVAGIIKSVFPGVGILTLKYYNQKASGQDNLRSTVEALAYAVDNNVDIINYSGGGPEPSIDELRILKKAESKGILVVAAAGNEESNIDLKTNAYYPASYGLKNIITVASHNRFHKILASSNYGKKSVDISAPGHRIKSALPGKKAGFLTGTSQATAFVSGVAALIKSQFPKLTAIQLKSLIIRSAKKDIRFMNKISSGGELNAGNALELAIKENSKKSKVKTRKIAYHLTKKTKVTGKIIYRSSLRKTASTKK